MLEGGMGGEGGMKWQQGARIVLPVPMVATSYNPSGSAEPCPQLFPQKMNHLHFLSCPAPPRRNNV